MEIIKNCMLVSRKNFGVDEQYLILGSNCFKVICGTSIYLECKVNKMIKNFKVIKEYFLYDDSILFEKETQLKIYLEALKKNQHEKLSWEKQGIKLYIYLNDSEWENGNQEYLKQMKELKEIEEVKKIREHKITSTEEETLKLKLIELINSSCINYENFNLIKNVLLGKNTAVLVKYEKRAKLKNERLEEYKKKIDEYLKNKTKFTFGKICQDLGINRKTFYNLELNKYIDNKRF